MQQPQPQQQLGTEPVAIKVETNVEVAGYDDFFSTDENQFIPTNQARVFETELTKRFDELEAEDSTKPLTVDLILPRVRSSSSALSSLDSPSAKSPSRVTSSTDCQALDEQIGATSPVNSDELIPLLFSHKIYRYNVRLNVYEQVSDEFAVTGWRNMYIAVQYKNQVICISQASGSVYRKVVRSSLHANLGEADSFIIPSDIHDFNETRALVFIDGGLYFIRPRDVYQLNLSDYTFKKCKKTGVGKWIYSVFTQFDRTIYGVDEESGAIMAFDFDQEQLTKLNSMRDWRDAGGMVTYNNNLIVFTNNGMFRMDPKTGSYKLLAREEYWSLYRGCIAKTDNSTVLFISSGNLYTWDLVKNTYKLLSRRWKVCNCVTTIQSDDLRDRNFLRTGSSLKSL